MRIITLNTWDLPTTPNRSTRMQKIAEKIAELDADIVCLQELWMIEDHTIITSILQNSGIIYSQYFYSGIAGSGLMILSRYRITHMQFYRYRLGGWPEQLGHGDFYCGKGVAHVVVDTPDGSINIYNTHLIAQYSDDRSDEYLAHRTAQIYELARFVEQTSADLPIIIVGDLNVLASHLGYQLLTTILRVTDTYILLNSDEGWTISPENPHQSEGKRIDYILYSDGLKSSLQPQNAEITLKFIPEMPDVAYSDHFGLLADFSISSKHPDTSVDHNLQTERELLQELVKLLKQGYEQASNRQGIHFKQTLGSGALITVASLLKQQEELSRRQFLSTLVTGAMSVLALYSASNILMTLSTDSDELTAFQMLIDEVTTHLQQYE